MDEFIEAGDIAIEKECDFLVTVLEIRGNKMRVRWHKGDIEGSMFWPVADFRLVRKADKPMEV